MIIAIASRTALCLAFCLTTAAGMAQIAVSVNDNKMVLDNGVPRVVANPQPDTVAIIDMKSMPPRLLDEIEVPASVAGPPLSVAVAPDESLALVTSAVKVSPTDPSKTVPDNRLSVIDLTMRPPRVIATLTTGASPAGVSINRAGTLALVANRADCTVSVFAIAGKTVTPAGTVSLGGAPDCGASHVAISPDGRSALVTRDNDHKISVLSIDGSKVEYTKRDMNPGLRPYGIAICVPGTIAVVPVLLKVMPVMDWLPFRMMISAPLTEDWLKMTLSAATGTVPVVPAETGLSDQFAPADQEPEVVFQ
jgi:DNA-binding beta-propeller fold protein YncE